MRVGLITASPQVGEKSANLKKREAHIKQADADLLIFGELFLTGYGKPNQLRVYAEKRDGKSIKKAKGLTKKHKKHLIFGCPIRKKNKIYNSALFVHPDRKIDLLQELFAQFSPTYRKNYFHEWKGTKSF